MKSSQHYYESLPPFMPFATTLNSPVSRKALSNGKSNMLFMRFKYSLTGLTTST